MTCWGGGGQIGELISRALARVGRQGVVTMEESRTAEDYMHVVEGMQFDRGYISPYFVTDPERMVGAPAASERPRLAPALFRFDCGEAIRLKHALLALLMCCHGGADALMSGRGLPQVAVHHRHLRAVQA